METNSRDVAAAMIDASEARQDTKFSKLDGRLDLLLSRVDEFSRCVDCMHDNIRDDHRSTRANIWVVALGLSILIVTVVALLPVLKSVL